MLQSAPSSRKGTLGQKETVSEQKGECDGSDDFRPWGHIGVGRETPDMVGGKKQKEGGDVL